LRRQRKKTKARNDNSLVSLTVYCLARELDLSVSAQTLQNYDRALVMKMEDAVYATLESGKEVFVVPDLGSVVFWGCSSETEMKITHALRQATFPSKAKLAEIESDRFSARYGNEAFDIRKDVFVLPVSQNQDGDRQCKFSISFSLAASAILSSFESELDERIEGFEKLPFELARKGKVSSLSSMDVKRKIGELSLFRASLNLRYDLIGEPEFCWNSPELNGIFFRCRQYLEIDSRLDIMNKRIDIIDEFLESVRKEQRKSYTDFLEWIIIVLIIFDAILHMIRCGFLFREAF